MRRYAVKVTETVSHITWVVAGTEEDAVEAAEQIWCDEGAEGPNTTFAGVDDRWVEVFKVEEVKGV